MSIQRRRSIRKLPSIKNKGIKGIKASFEFNKNLHSIDLQEIYFTNFIKKDKFKYKFVKKEIDAIKKQMTNMNDYEIKEENYSKKNRQRVNTIYEETYKAANLIPLVRIKHIYNKEFQIFCEDENGIYKIQLVDLHHLIIPAADKEHGEEKANIEKKYNDVRGGIIDLKDLIA